MWHSAGDARTLNLREGDFVAFAQKQNRVLIKPKRVVDPQNDLTPDEARKIRHVVKQVRTGNRPWSQIKHEQGL